jgi:hypothetical protein
MQTEMGLSWRPHVEVPPWMMSLLALGSLAIGIALLILVSHPELMPPSIAKASC